MRLTYADDLSQNNFYDFATSLLVTKRSTLPLKDPPPIFLPDNCCLWPKTTTMTAKNVASFDCRSKCRILFLTTGGVLKVGVSSPLKPLTPFRSALGGNCRSWSLYPLLGTQGTLALRSCLWPAYAWLHLLWWDEEAQPCRRLNNNCKWNGPTSPQSSQIKRTQLAAAPTSFHGGCCLGAGTAVAKQSEPQMKLNALPPPQLSMSYPRPRYTGQHRYASTVKSKDIKKHINNRNNNYSKHQGHTSR